MAERGSGGRVRGICNWGKWDVGGATEYWWWSWWSCGPFCACACRACVCVVPGQAGQVCVCCLKSSKYSNSSKPDRQTMNLAGKPEAKAWQVNE